MAVKILHLVDKGKSLNGYIYEPMHKVISAYFRYVNSNTICFRISLDIYVISNMYDVHVLNMVFNAVFWSISHKVIQVSS